MSAGEKHDSWLKVEIPSQYQQCHPIFAKQQCNVWSKSQNSATIPIFVAPKNHCDYLWLVEISNFRRSTTAHCPGTRSAARPGRLEPWKTWKRIQQKSLYGSNFFGCLDVCVCCICHCFWVVIWYILIYNIYIRIYIYMGICWYMLIFVGRVVFAVRFTVTSWFFRFSTLGGASLGWTDQRPGPQVQCTGFPSLGAGKLEPSGTIWNHSKAVLNAKKIQNLEICTSNKKSATRNTVSTAIIKIAKTLDIFTCQERICRCLDRQAQWSTRRNCHRTVIAAGAQMDAAAKLVCVHWIFNHYISLPHKTLTSLVSIVGIKLGIARFYILLIYWNLLVPWPPSFNELT